MSKNAFKKTKQKQNNYTNRFKSRFEEGKQNCFKDDVFYTIYDKAIFIIQKKKTIIHLNETHETLMRHSVAA